MHQKTGIILSICQYKTKSWVFAITLNGLTVSLLSWYKELEITSEGACWKEALHAEVVKSCLSADSRTKSFYILKLFLQRPRSN